MPHLLEHINQDITRNCVYETLCPQPLACPPSCSPGNLFTILLQLTESEATSCNIFKAIKTQLVQVLFLCPPPPPPKEFWEPYSNRTVRPSVPLRVGCISPIFFKIGIPNLVCGNIFGWRSVACHFRVSVTLTSDLGFRIIVPGAYLLYYLR